MLEGRQTETDLSDHQKALIDIARDALIGAQLEVRTTWFYEGQVHLLAAL